MMTLPLNLLRTALVLVLWASAAWAQALSLPRIFSENMVFQRDLPVKVWGWAKAGQSVEVSFAGQTRSGTAGADGRWEITLGPLPASAEARELAVTAGPEKVVIKNVVVGEVWICSGQSNMEWVLRDTDNAQDYAGAADFPAIRQFKVPHVIHTKPQKDLPGEWKVCSPATAPDFTAVGYHFGLQLHKKLNVPIGLVNTSWGGTRIEPWTDPEGFKISPALQETVAFIANADQTYRRNVAGQLDGIESWVKECRGALATGSEIPAFPGKVPEHPLMNAGQPTAIYNAMVAPLIPYGIRGAIWYQGESNNGEGMLYYEKMRALIGSWRQLWGQGDFPFLYVQLAPFRYNRPEALPALWEAQTAALTLPNTGMAVITDIGNVADIHPRNKAEVGRRLSLWALAKTYGVNNLVFSGPLFKAMQVTGNKAVLSFDHAEGLKSLDGKPLRWFTIAGDDKQFSEAQAEVAGQTVVVSSPSVPKPASVRLGWHETAEPNLGNGAGLPASPFRTDRW